MLKVENLEKKVATQEQELTILSDVSFELSEGDSLAIVGASGSGKSTLLSLLAGLDSASKGSIRLAEYRLDDLDEDARAEVRAKYVGFIFQSFHLLPGLTALENVMLPIELKNKKAAKEKALDILEQVDLSHRVNHYPNQLSGGEQQRVAIARAFASEPKLLFADEPTGNLDSANGQKITELLFDLNSQFGTTLVLVTHDQKLANRCERQITLSAGRIQNDSLVPISGSDDGAKAE